MQEYFFEGIKRLDWGFGNPNITAGLLAILMMAVWGLSPIHRWFFWISLASFTTLGVFLVQTISRGGVLAALAGGAVLLLFARRPWRKSHLISIASCLLGLVIYSLVLGSAPRFAKGIVEEDASVGNRWIIYRITPSMMVDAPGGWGIKQADEAFHNFYQPEGRLERYGSLVSSHLTWLAEMSWLGRAGYVFGWLTALFLCLPSSRRRWYSVALATWVAFGTAAMFTTMANRWFLWVIPGVLLLLVLIERCRGRDWPGKRSWLIPFGGTATICALLLVLGTLHRTNPAINLREGWVVLSNQEIQSEETVWLLEPDMKVLGQSYGQKIRTLTKDPTQERSFALGWKKGELTPGNTDCLVISGKATEMLVGPTLEKAKKAGRWLLLNPEQPTKELFDTISQCPPIQVVWGEFNPEQSRLVWQSLANQNSNVTFEKIQAAGKYLPNWIDLVAKPVLKSAQK